MGSSLFDHPFRHEIKVVVMLHRPQYLESAAALVQLQEEVADMVRQKRRGGDVFYFASPLSVPVPPHASM